MQIKKKIFSQLKKKCIFVVMEKTFITVSNEDGTKKVEFTLDRDGGEDVKINIKFNPTVNGNDQSEYLRWAAFIIDALKD